MQGKTKKGATSLITTMFFTLLAGILVLSFVSIMLSNINESTNYNLSQSAYDSALAGIEDAKVMLLEYNSCLARGDNSSARCATLVSLINASGSEDDCDIVRNALGRANGDNETLIRTDNSSTNAGKGVDSTFDMAYTCVKVAMKTSDYLGTITKDSDMKVIPLRTHSASETGAVSEVNRIRIEWFSNQDASSIFDNGLEGNYAGMIQKTTGKTFTTNKFGPDDITTGMNQFGVDATLPPSITIGLIQADYKTEYGQKGFLLSDFVKNNNLNTDRGRLTLRPVDSSSTSKPRIANDNSKGYAVSANAANLSFTNTNTVSNSPIDVECLNPDTELGAEPYACSVEIDLPKGYHGGQPIDILRFLTLSTPYSKPDISFRITMLKCGYDAAHPELCENVKFVGVQSSVDSTGRANDLFRRIEARVELIDIGYPFPKYTLGLYCNPGDDCSDSGNIVKNYRASYNCWNITNGNSQATCGNSDTANNYASEGLDGGF